MLHLIHPVTLSQSSCIIGTQPRRGKNYDENQRAACPMLFRAVTVHERGGVAPALWANVDIMPEGYIVPDTCTALRALQCRWCSEWDTIPVWDAVRVG